MLCVSFLEKDFCENISTLDNVGEIVPSGELVKAITVGNMPLLLFYCVPTSSIKPSIKLSSIKPLP